MILNGNDIKKLIEEKKLLENYNSSNFSSGSYDLTIASKVLKIKKTFKTIELSNANQIENMYEEINIGNGYTLKHGECIFAVLNEKINLPNDLVAHIRPRTSLSRLGLNINIQHINSGYSGILNIAIYNMSPNNYILRPNLRIGQIVFEEITDGITEDLLYSNSTNSVYQNEDGLSGSKICYDNCVGKVYRHFKGNYYFVESISMDSETKETIIVYKPLYPRKDSMLWTRPASMFFEEIDSNRKDNITGQKHRFELCDDLEKDYTKK